ncbi:MAG: hypothetical protein ABJH05_15335 [Fulvivirga sp.]
MKTRGHIAVLVAISILCLYAPTYAQEDGFSMPNVDREPASNTSTAGEGSRSGYTIDPVKKSAERIGADKKDVAPRKVEDKKPEELKSETRSQEKPQGEKTSNPSNTSKKPDEDAEDVLSFNLLYYMIQKFKFSDVIDE